MDRPGWRATKSDKGGRRRIDKIRSHLSRYSKRFKTKASETKTKMQFDNAIKLNNLGAIIDAQYGEWGHFHKEAADIIWLAASHETQPYFRPTLAAMLAVTMMNESTFRLYVPPNTNTKNRPENIHCPAAWDYGPCQLNFFWKVLEAWEGNILMRGLSWRKVFGNPPFEPDKPFTGDPLFNTMACARIIMSKTTMNDPNSRDMQEMQVTLYTGGSEERMAHRREDWRKYGQLFQEFYTAYI